MVAQKEIRVLEGDIEAAAVAITAVPPCIEVQRAENKAVEEDLVRETSMVHRIGDEMSDQQRRFEDSFRKRDEIQKRVRFARWSAVRSMVINMYIEA